MQPVETVRRVVRPLWRAPGFTVTVILILGMAIGMSSAMLTVFEGLLLRPLPIADQERVVTLLGGGRGAAQQEVPVNLEQYRRFRSASDALSDVAAFAHWGAFAFPVSDGDRPLALRQAAVTANFFQLLGVAPVLGRLFEPGDDRPWGPADENAGDYNIVLSYGAWRRVFGGDPGVIGQRLRMPTTHWDPVIIGVAPPGLDFPRGVDYWIPANYNSLNLVGRLRPGASYEAARLEYQRFIDEDPDYAAMGENTLRARVAPIAESVVGDVRPALLALTAAVGLLLILASVNIGNLLLVRATDRSREFAIRRALGAGTGTIVWALFAEGVALALAGGLLGLALARSFLHALLRLAPDTLPRTDVIAEAGTPYVVAAGVTTFALLVAVLLPVLATRRANPFPELRADARAGGERRGQKRLRLALVAAQMALALVVLAGAGLLLRSFTRLAGLDFGFATERLSVLMLAPPYDGYVRACGGAALPVDSLAACMEQRIFALHDRIESRLAAVPGVAGVSSILVPPFLGASVWMTKVAAEGQTDAESNPWFGYEAVGPDFFRTLQLPVLEGRAFTAADMRGPARVAVVSEGVARTLWPGERAPGRRFHGLGEPHPDSMVTVIGVVPDVHYREHRASTPTIYRPYAQAMAQGSFVVRTDAPLDAVLPSLEAALLEVDASLVLTKAETMDELVAPQLAQPRLQALLLTAFALAAVLIAAVGLYGVMAQAVARRRHELGVRMALGATAGQLRRMVLREATLVTAAGGVAGLACALAASRLLSGLLFRVSPADPLTLVGVCALLLVVGIVAAGVPARRATRVDPLVALRAD